MMFLCITLFPALCAATLDYSVPISPADYSDLIGNGFSTNWFKTAKPLSKYHANNAIDVSNEGFNNLRLRCRADKHIVNTAGFASFLLDLNTVVDDCLANNVAPIVSWIHHVDEANATEEARQNYIAWWTAVAESLKTKDYRLSYNTFTELGRDGCGDSCEASLRENPDLYNSWTTDVVNAIRMTEGNNRHRILILASPGKTAKDLHLINETIYLNDSKMMVEWHLFASGPNKKVGSQKEWEGDGSIVGQGNVETAISDATQYTTSTGLLSYLGAWMPEDNSSGALNETEVIYFAKYFVEQLGSANIPWSLNVLDTYYETKFANWRTEIQDIKGQSLNMSRVLDEIKLSMS